MDDRTGASLPPNPEAVDDQTVEIDLSSSTVLDLTSFQLHDLDSVELPPTLTELDLTANRLSSLDPRIAYLSNLKKLSLRQNLVDDAAVEPISTWHALLGLEVLKSPCLLIDYESDYLGLGFSRFFCLFLEKMNCVEL